MMTDSEICREYRLAKDKDKQIGIIADQCGMSKNEIKKVLVDCGEMEQPKPKKSAAKQNVPDKMPELSQAVADALFARIDELDRQIKPIEDERKELDKQIEPLRREFDEIAAFLKGCGKVVGGSGSAV